MRSFTSRAQLNLKANYSFILILSLILYLGSTSTNTLSGQCTEGGYAHSGTQNQHQQGQSFNADCDGVLAKVCVYGNQSFDELKIIDALDPAAGGNLIYHGTGLSSYTSGNYTCHDLTVPITFNQGDPFSIIFRRSYNSIFTTHFSQANTEGKRIWSSSYNSDSYSTQGSWDHRIYYTMDALPSCDISQSQTLSKHLY